MISAKRVSRRGWRYVLALWAVATIAGAVVGLLEQKPISKEPLSYLQSSDNFVQERSEFLGLEIRGKCWTVCGD